MILKGSQRANGADLATHLMQALDNETVEIAEVSGTVATDLHGAFAEMEATAAGTNAKNYLYSLSINPSAPISRAQYDQAITRIAAALGLAGQPRAIVFHVKDGREHCHVVWSKIDAAAMKAIHMAYDHAALCDLSCELAGAFGLNLPPGLQAWEEKRRTAKTYLDATLAENAITAATGITPEQRAAEITAAYNQTDGIKAFYAALIEKGYMLAQGDRRRLVVVDRFGDVHSLTRHIKGHKSRAVKLKLAAISLANLPSVDKARDYIRAHQQAIEDRRSAKLDKAMAAALPALRRRQAARRLPLNAKEQDLFIKHASERMALHAAQKTETQSIAGTIITAAGKALRRVKAAVLRLLERSPALRSILAPITRDPRLGTAARHDLENQALAERHARERAMTAREQRAMTAVEKRERKALKNALRRQIIETDAHSPSLMTHPVHENEQLHQLHVRLIERRRRKLIATFNAKANPSRKRSEDERSDDIKISWDWHVRPPNRPRGT